MRTNRPSRRPSPVAGHGWSIIHVREATTIRAEPRRLAALYLDHARWPSLFPATIRRTRELARNDGATLVEVDHRTEGRVVNVIRPLSPTVIALDERKPRYDATFVNRFEPAPGGSRYTVEATIRFRMPYALIAPLLGSVVRRRVLAFVLQPMLEAVERESAGPRPRATQPIPARQDVNASPHGT